jgi:hypothetical protein
MTPRDKGILPENYEIDKGTPSWDGGLCIHRPMFIDGGGDMREVAGNGAVIFELGTIWQLTRLPIGELGDSIIAIAHCIDVLKGFASVDVNQKDLPHSVGQAILIAGKLEQLIQGETPTITSGGRDIFIYDIMQLRTLLFSELGKLTIIILEDIRGYSANALWKNPSCLVADNVAPYLSVFVHQNIRDAAKCLVLNCATAAGFHAMRSVEQVTRIYYELVTGNSHKYTDSSGKEREKGLGTLAQELVDKYTSLERNKPNRLPSGNLGIIGPMIKGLCKLYRDPLSHPDIITLDDSQAITSFVQSIEVISLVVLDSQFVKPLGSVIF